MTKNDSEELGQFLIRKTIEWMIKNGKLTEDNRWSDEVFKLIFSSISYMQISLIQQHAQCSRKAAITILHGVYDCLINNNEKVND